MVFTFSPSLQNSVLIWSLWFSAMSWSSVGIYTEIQHEQLSIFSTFFHCIIHRLLRVTTIVQNGVPTRWRTLQFVVDSKPGGWKFCPGVDESRSKGEGSISEAGGITWLDWGLGKTRYLYTSSMKFSSLKMKPDNMHMRNISELMLLNTRSSFLL